MASFAGPSGSSNTGARNIFDHGDNYVVFNHTVSGRSRHGVWSQDHRLLWPAVRYHTGFKGHIVSKISDANNLYLSSDGFVVDDTGTTAVARPGIVAGLGSIVRAWRLDMSTPW